ncbi:proton-conducting transporter membrane subunit [Alkalilimnicola sp. S0819]|uniref:proton-conducting transporter transmembrane domain-containing protein n=1 Tax=Alkalilimnicola sp. S0819 TaxID=2613922 RepID=UPI0012621785|nr:proton-conducting transporter membrane subunit [Alkalilimnicola sp. S0819]KAB7627475.1 NADH/ubiquinone/plastoquinone (complex I) [Alkalilimnicola sp. S0819]MPQ15627.1 NADH/ubiquinone/plastoquinone (complex I) [Alkalilimnicola sp. S0819]
MSALWPALLYLIVLLPLGLGLLAVLPGGAPRAARALPGTPLPALLAALLLPQISLQQPLITFGITLGLDAPGRLFLLFSAVIWMLAGWHLLRTRPWQRPAGARLLCCFLLCQAGNLGVIIALDPIGYYIAFSLLSLAAYGLIVVEPGARARQAGRLYLTLALLGEMAMLAGFLYLDQGREGLLVALLLFVGMGVKHGVLPLHVWLPRAHGLAPYPCSALLSGALLKAGLLGWIRFLPETGAGLTALAPWMLGLGLAAAFYGALVGVLQSKPKMLLGYSSISQMGLVTALLGSSAGEPRTWPLAAAAAGAFALHHASVKAALFLGLGVARRGRAGGWVYPTLLMLSLSLAALPLSGGYLLKLWMSAAGQAPIAPTPAGPWKNLLPWSSVATGLLMSRFLYLSRRQPRPSPLPGMDPVGPAPFLILAAWALLMPWVWSWLHHPYAPATLLADSLKWKSLWPWLVILPLAGFAWWVATRGWRLRPIVPAGDIVVPLEVLAARLRLPDTARKHPHRHLRRGALRRRLDHLEARLLHLPRTGIVLLGLILLLAALSLGS